MNDDHEDCPETNNFESQLETLSPEHITVQQFMTLYEGKFIDLSDLVIVGDMGTLKSVTFISPTLYIVSIYMQEEFIDHDLS